MFIALRPEDGHCGVRTELGDGLAKLQCHAMVQDLTGLEEQGLASFPKLLSRQDRNTEKRKIATPIYTLVFRERTEGFIVRCPPRLYMSSPLWPVRTGGNKPPKLQLFQEKRENS